METVSYELIKKIYAHINRTEKQASLLSNRKKWDRLTSALTVLEDTSCAIEYYLESDYPSDYKGKYLYTYGLMQALYVQGDAANSISVALFDKEIKFQESYPELNNVRVIRNDVIGHPTNRGGSSSVTLGQISMTKESFTYWIDDTRTQETKSVDVDVYESIKDTATCVNGILQDAVDQLDAEFRSYIEQHRGRKMKEIFNMLHYAKEKTLLDSAMGQWGYDATKNMVDRCEKELELRYGSVDTADWYKYLLDEIHEIYTLIDEGVPQIPYPFEAGFEKYMMQLLFVKLEELESYCEETDEYFENYGEEPESCNEDININIVFSGEDEFTDEDG